MSSESGISRFHELRDSIDEVERFLSIRKKSPKLLLFGILTILLIQVEAYIIYLWDFNAAFPVLGGIGVYGPWGGYSLNLFGILAIATAAVYVLASWLSLGRQLSAPVSNKYIQGESKSASEIAQKILLINWQELIRDTSRAKTGYIIFLMTSVLTAWVLSFLAFYVVSSVGGYFFGLQINIFYLLAGAVVFALSILWRWLGDRYERLWRMDGLIWEMRWLYTEISESEFPT
jgi:hypothetical protein